MKDEWKNTKRRTLIATMAFGLAFLMASPLLFSSGAQASVGYEREKLYPNGESEYGEVYVEYPDNIYYDPAGGTGVTKFPIEFSVRQDSFTKRWDWLSTVREVPDWWQVDVYIDDRSGIWDDTFSLMRFYPQQATDVGTTLQWSFDASAGGRYGQIGVTATVQGSPSAYSYNYDKNPTTGYNPIGEYVKLGSLFVEYNQGVEWSGATSNGAIVLSVRDDFAKNYANDHLIYIKLVFTLVWEGGNDTIHNHEVKYVKDLVIGNDSPSSTDCMLYVKPGYCNGS